MKNGNRTAGTRPVVERAGKVFTSEQIDKAMDRAARVAEAIVAQFAAAPTEMGHAVTVVNQRDSITLTGVPAVEVAVEFFVPPLLHDLFRHELEGQLQRQSAAYLAARGRGELGPVIVRSMPMGSFHQWRIVWRTSSDAQHRQRWSTDRAMLDSVLDQARNGWHEMAI